MTVGEDRSHAKAPWRWWDQVLLRGAGFPAAGVLALADPGLAATAAAVAELDPSDGAWSAYRGEFTVACRRMSAKLQEIARSEAFRSAVTWQNHHLMAGAIWPFLRADPDCASRNSKHRQREELVASYWQRYCVKNDSIGFFGPVGWGQLEPDAATHIQSGPQLVASTSVFFESWAIARVASVLESQPGMREWLMPRRAPFVRLDGCTLTPPLGAPVRLPETDAAVLRTCDGTVRAREVAEIVNAAAVTDPDHRLSAADSFTIIERLRRKRWLSWTFDLPVSPRPEQELRRFLEQIDDETLRASCLVVLAQLESGMENVRGARDAMQLCTALSALDQTFAQLTGSSPTRNEGRTYGGRTLVYSDCRRDIEFSIGADIFAALAPVELLAENARWFCWNLAQVVRTALNDVYERLSGNRSATVDLATLWFSSSRVLREEISRTVAELTTESTRRWRSILGLPGQDARRHYRRALLEPQVCEAFAAPGFGWAGARYISPDVLVLQPGGTTGRHDRPMLVLGELHMAINTQRSYCFVTQHRDPDALRACIDLDSPEPRLYPVLPRESLPRLTVRTRPALARDCDFLIEHTSQTVRAGRPRLLRSSEVAVVESGDTLALVLPGGERFDILDIFAEVLMDAVIDRFQVSGDAPYSPRITVDRLIISRETWRYDARDLLFATITDEALRFARASTWRRALQLPRHVFVQPGLGEKPFYVDFDSPVYVNILSRAARRALEAGGMLTIVEMLPAFEHLWLRDNAGREYSSELRFAAYNTAG